MIYILLIQLNITISINLTLKLEKRYGASQRSILGPLFFCYTLTICDTYWQHICLFDDSSNIVITEKSKEGIEI